MKRIWPYLVIGSVLAGIVLTSINSLPERGQGAPDTPPSLSPPPGGTRELSFPTSLQGFQLTRLIEGEPAIRDIEQLHGGVTMEVAGAFIAIYESPGESFVLWITVSNTVEEAKYLLEVMDEKIPASPVFTGRQVLELPQNTYYYVTGAGMENFYWHEGRRVYWVGIRGGEIMETLTLVTKQLVPYLELVN